ncbi:MAG: hypothetical protein COA79_25040 [Planctomycetota bacterium]|nr:MAG: hypothetical protein COA79_25040 [Planctomycetota bacterium]
MEIITRFLKRVNSKRQLYHATFVLLISLIIASGLLCILSLLNQSIFFQEKTSFIILSISILILTVGILSALGTIFSRIKNYANVSQLIENENRIFRDSLNGSAFIIDQSNSSSQISELEQLMIHTTKNKIHNNSFNLSFLKPTHFNKLLGIGLPLILICITTSLLFNNLSLKAYWAAKDIYSGTSTYFAITPGDATIRTGSTLQVKVKLNREQRIGAPLYIFINQNDQYEKFALTHKGDNNYIFNIYSIENNCNYYINNYTNTSSIHSINVYELPKFKTKKITVSPPHYTRIKSSIHNEGEYLTVPENSSILIEFETNKPVNAFIQFSNNTQPFKVSKNGRYFYQWRVKKYTEYSILLKDKSGHEFKTDPNWIIETIPDLPPIADITTPKDDQSYYGVERIKISTVLYDDYQVDHANLVFDIPNLGIKRIPINFKKNKKNGITINKNLYVNLLNFNLQNGQIISYYLEAVDNKKLVAQFAISDVKFLNIVPGKVESSKNEKKGDKKKQQKQDFRLDDLFAEAKKIYRNSLPLKFEPDLETKRNEILEFGNSLGDLRINISKRNQQLQKISGSNKLGQISYLFEDLIEKIDSAEKQMRDFDITKSMQNQMRGLQNIHKLIKLLSKPKEKAKGEESSSDKSEKEKKKDQKKKQDLKKSIKDLAEKLEEAKQANDSLNQKLSKSNNKLDKNEKDFFTKEKEQIKEEITSIKDEMQKFKELFQTADILQSANKELRSEIDKIKKGLKQNSLQHSKKSSFLIDKALKNLNEMLKQINQNEFDQLESQIKKMIAKQQQLKKESKATANNPGKQKELSEQQSKMAQDIKDFKKTAQNTLDSIEDKAPQSFKELEKTLEQLTKDNLERKAKKASKSIFYGMKSKAEQEQDKILKSLSKTQKGLQQAKSKMPDVSKEALLKSLQDLAKLQKKGKKQSENKSAKELKETIEKMNQKKTPQFLKDVIRLAEQLKDSKPGEAGITIAELVQETISLVEEELRKMEFNKLLKKKIQQQSAPDKYKKMVEKYFKNLSRQPSQ